MHKMHDNVNAGITKHTHDALLSVDAFVFVKYLQYGPTKHTHDSLLSVDEYGPTKHKHDALRNFKARCLTGQLLNVRCIF